MREVEPRSHEELAVVFDYERLGKTGDYVPRPLPDGGVEVTRPDGVVVKISDSEWRVLIARFRPLHTDSHTRLFGVLNELAEAVIAETERSAS